MRDDGKGNKFIFHLKVKCFIKYFVNSSTAISLKNAISFQTSWLLSSCFYSFYLFLFSLPIDEVTKNPASRLDTVKSYRSM